LKTAFDTPWGERAAFASYLGILGDYPGFDGTYRGIFATGRWNQPGTRLGDITDGASNTLMLGERPPPASLQAGRWYAGNWMPEPFSGPNNSMYVNHGPEPFDSECARASGRFGPGRVANPCDRFHYWSLHPGGANFALADGSVRYLPYSARDVLPDLATFAGGEPTPVP
jgi:prepilin-type processing-associated H-X9-DG protein